MESIRNLYRIGTGPSSSHTMAPRRAAGYFRRDYPQAVGFRVALFGSLAATGRGHLIDVALQKAFDPMPIEIVWLADQHLPRHPNGMRFEALDQEGRTLASRDVYSTGGGALENENGSSEDKSVYQELNLSQILSRCEASEQTLWEYVEECEGTDIWNYLREIWAVMQEAIERGLQSRETLPGELHLPRRAYSFYQKVRTSDLHVHRDGFLSSYALAVAEENAANGLVVTAPTCGSCGVLPAILRYLKETRALGDDVILRALATAGLIGNIVKHNASISGAEVGCQGEIGTASAMAAGAAAQLLGGTMRHVEYAAEMGLEHFLGLTCDPVAGLVQIPCIERNAFAAARSLSCANYALYTDGVHQVQFDDVVSVMWLTGKELLSSYRETSSGGLAKIYASHCRK